MDSNKGRRKFIQLLGLTGLGTSSLIKNGPGKDLSTNKSNKNEPKGFLKATNTKILSSNSFQSTVIKVDITPQTSQNLMGYNPRMSTDVRDNIYHRILILNDGNSDIVIVSSDIVRVSPSTYDEVAKSLEELTGIKKDNFWWCFTHTHSAPEVGSSGVIPLFFQQTKRYENNKYNEEYAEFVKSSLLKGVITAKEELIPAKLGISWGYSRANINRRARDIDNKIFFGENPDGPVDRKIGIIKIESEQEEPIALLANYPIHGTVLPSTDTRISGDVPGVVSEYVEKVIGAPLLFINGAEGDIGPRYSVTGGEKSIEKADRFLNQFRYMLGDKIIEAYNRIKATSRNVRIVTDRIIIETPMRNSLRGKWPLELSEYTRKSSTGIDLIRFPVNFLFLNNDISIWGAPCELFCEISNYIREHSPFPNTLFFGLTNGSVAYFPTKKEMELGGYEASTSPFTPDAEKDLIDTVLAYLNKVSKQS